MTSSTTERTNEKLCTVFAEYCVPIELVSGNCPQFISETFDRFLKGNNVHHIQSPPFHLSTNGEAVLRACKALSPLLMYTDLFSVTLYLVRVPLLTL